MLREIRSARLVKGQDLNHHGTLFAGRIAEWFTESCFLAAARFTGSPENIVCVKIHGLAFTKPANPGDTIEIVTRVVKTGTKSITVCGQVFINEDTESVVKGFATFVTVDAEGKSYAHGLSLPAEYIAEHRALYDEASALQK
ncbi:MAG TPA: hotdog domain-containing protein [Spirochaetales bacterium]|nr:hotdog domain-containing protein [Spirochaetales bacterium]